MLADDDDIYMPYHIQQSVDGIIENKKDAWKPEKSFFATQNDISLVKNTLEASVIVKMSRIREIGFRTDITGYEGLSWYTKLRDEGQLDENNVNYIPSYCFNWGDIAEIAGHKQSGAIGSENNFENHKEASKDYAKRPIDMLSKKKIMEVYKPYYEFINNNISDFHQDYINKYFLPTQVFQEEN